MADDIAPKKRGFDRRSFLLGAAGGAAVTALGAAGVATVREKKSRALRTPAAVEAGRPAEIADVVRGLAAGVRRETSRRRRARPTSS